MRILIAEDDVATAKALKILLEKAKYTVDIVHTGTDAWDYIQQVPYEVIVLDIMMPGMSGLEVLSLIRSHNMKNPVLLLTAKSEIEDRVNGLDAGADDYLPKPFSTRELIARVKALGRRSGVYSESIMTAGNLVLDGNRYELRVDDNSISLTNKEYQLLELFMLHQGQIFSSEHLMEKIWGFDTDSDTEVVWTHISFVRKKMRNLGANVEIKTIRGLGYSLEVV